jgi:hypothetical protein
MHMYMYMCTCAAEWKRGRGSQTTCMHTRTSSPGPHAFTTFANVHKPGVFTQTHVFTTNNAWQGQLNDGSGFHWTIALTLQPKNIPIWPKVKIGCLHAAKRLTSYPDLPPRLSKNYLTAIWAASALGGLAGYEVSGVSPCLCTQATWKQQPHSYGAYHVECPPQEALPSLSWYM